MGASSRLRTYQFLPLWEQAGHTIRVSSFFNDDYLTQVYAHRRPEVWNVLRCYLRRFVVLFSVFRYDYVWVEKELFPFLPAWAERLLSAVGVRLLLDYDDAVFHNYDLSKKAWVRTLFSNKIDQVMKAATYVFAGNEYLADRARKAGADRVIILRTVVDHEKYRQIPILKKHRTLPTGVGYSEVADASTGSPDLPTIGWIGSPSTLKYLGLVSEALSELYQRVPFRFVLINGGSVRYGKYLALPKEAIVHLVWSEPEEVAQLSALDIGIMPLPDDPWEQGKCAYKLIQYMACGLPVVASPVGMNNEVVCHGQNGFLASTQQEWVGYLEVLLRSSETRQAMGIAGKALVEREYTLAGNFQKLKRVLSEEGSGQ
ncbi:glycosyltransferase family 4 protein [Algoriphagus terrigena]|uniref:glycosyltransferase family 4 protein n=1 Tax=Algoriphagus terrigena TaxID=344884 RepID=UPI00041D81E5|nr:glycosyltransferase family 4 protein [Algoriphagus terrigena]